MRKSGEKWKQTGAEEEKHNRSVEKVRNSRDLQYRATFCPAQSRDVRSRRRVWSRAFVWRPGRCRRQISLRLLCRRCSASTVVSFSDSPTILNTRLCSGECALCTSTSCRTARQFSAAHYMWAEQNRPVLDSCLNRALMQCKANVLKSFWYVFFFCPCFKNQKYCSFKYCALHRIFCHKLVNIYIFFFSIFRHILSYIQDNKMLLFSFVIFFCLLFFSKRNPWECLLTVSKVSTRASAVTVCVSVTNMSVK